VKKDINTNYKCKVHESRRIYLWLSTK